MHGALPADNIFLLALLLYNLSPCQAKNEEDNPVKTFFTDMNTAITSVIASKFNVAMRLLQQDFTKYFRAVLARWTQDLSVRTNEARFDNLDNFSDQEILAHAYKIANMSTARTSNSSSTTSERPSDAKEPEPLEDADEEIVKISSGDEEEDTWNADLAVNDGSVNSVNGDFDSGDDSANEFEEPDGEEPEIRVVDSAISLIDSESNAKNSDTESTIQSRDQVDSDIMNHSRDQVDADIINLASQLARLNGTTRVSQDSLLDEANAIVDEERFKTLNALNGTFSNASTDTVIHVNDKHMTRSGLDVLISKSLKLPSEIINNEANKNVSDTVLDAVNVTFTKVTAIDERYRNVTGFVLNAHSSAPKYTSHEINIEHKHVTSIPQSSIAENMSHKINIVGTSMNMTNISFDANNLTTTDAGLNMDDKPKHVISSIPMSRPSSLVSKSAAVFTNITLMKTTQTGDNSGTGEIIASNLSSVPIVSATFSIPTTEVNPGRNGAKLASESNFNEKKMPAPWPKAMPSNVASKGNGSERRGFAELMIFDAADPALDEEQPLSPPFMKKDIIITHTVDLNARAPEPIKMTAEEHKLMRVKTPSESNRNGFLNSQIDRLATPSSTYPKPLSKLRQKRDISNSPSGNNPRFPLLCALKFKFTVFIDVSRLCDNNTAMESGSSDRKYFLKYADQHPLGGVGGHAEPNSIAWQFNTHSARLSRYAENFIHDRLKYMQHRKMLGKKPRQKRAAVYLNHKEAASNEAYFPIWIGHRFSTSITSFPHHNLSISPDKPKFSRYHPRFPPYTQSMSPDKPEFSRHHSRFPRYKQSVFPDKPEFPRHHPRSKKRQRIKRAAFDALMSMIANKWAKSNNDEAEETLHTDHTDPELDSQESVEQSSQMGPPVEYSSSYLPKEHRIFDPEPGSHSREAFNFVKQGTRFRANEVEHPFLSLLRQYSQGTSKSSHFDVLAHELHSKISELCASFHAAWLHTLTATTESAKPSTATTEKSVLTSAGKSRPSQLTDRRPKRSYAAERTVKSSDDQVTYESYTQPEVSPSYRKPQIKIKSKNDRIKRAYPEYLPLSAGGKEITKSKTSVSIPPTRKHIMRLERKSGPALDASSPSKPQNLIKSIENFKKLAKLDLEQLENIDLEDGFAIDELDADALGSPSPSDPTEDLVEIHALPSNTEATPSTPGNAKSTNANRSNVNSSNVKSTNVKRLNAKSTYVKSTDVKRPNAKSTDVKSTDVKSTDVKSTDVKSTNVKSTNVKSIDSKSTNVEIPNVTLRTYSESSIDSYSRINTATENLAGESGICQPCQSTPLPPEVKMGFSDEDSALTSTSLNEGLEQGFEESYPTFPTPPHSFDKLSSAALQNELEPAVEGVKPTNSTLSSSGREAVSLESYPPRLSVTDAVESNKAINYPNPSESSDEMEEATESKRKVYLSQVDSYDSRTGIHSNGTDDTELVEEIDVFKTVNTQGLSEFPDDVTLPTFPVQNSRERTESPDDEPLTTSPGKINEGPPDYQESTGSPHFKPPSPVLISPVNPVRKSEAERLVSPAFRLISSGSPVGPLNTNVITELPEILSNAKSSDIAEDDISWKSVGVREPDISEDGIRAFPTPPSDLVEDDISRKSIGVRGPDISEDGIGVFPTPPSLPDAAQRPFIHASNQDTNTQINESNRLTLKKYYQTHPADKLKSAEVSERMFYTRDPPTWRGHDPSTVYPTPEIIPPFTQRPISKSVPAVVSTTIQDATGDRRRILWQPFLFEDVRSDVNHRRTRFYNRSNRPQSRLYVKEDRIPKEGATDSEGVVIAGSSLEAARPEIEEFVRLSTRQKNRKRLPKVRTTSENKEEWQRLLHLRLALKQEQRFVSFFKALAFEEGVVGN